MGNTECKPAIFCNQEGLSVEELGHQTNHKTFGLQSILSARCVGAVVVKNLWGWPTNDWYNLGTTPQEGTHFWHCLDISELEAGEPRDLKMSMKLYLTIFYCAHRLLPGSVIIRETSSRNWWEQIQWPTAKYWAEIWKSGREKGL